MNNRIFNQLYSGNKICWTIIKYILYLIIINSIQYQDSLKFDTIYNILLSSTAAILFYVSIFIIIKELINNYIRFSENIHSNLNAQSINISAIARLNRKLYLATLINLVFSFIIIGIIPLVYNIYSIYSINKLKIKNKNSIIDTTNSAKSYPNCLILLKNKIEFKHILILVVLSLLLVVIFAKFRLNKNFETKKANNPTTLDLKYECTPRKVFDAIGKPIISTTAAISITNSDTLLLRVLSYDSKYYIIIGGRFKPPIDSLISLKLHIGDNEIFLNIDSFEIESINKNRVLMALCKFPELSASTLGAKIDSILIEFNNKKIFPFSNLNSISLFQLLKCVEDEVQKQNAAIPDKSIKSEPALNSESYSNSNTNFYIVRHSALKSEESAKNLVFKLRSKFINTDYLWIPQYRTLGTNQFFLVYYGPFQSEKDCSDFIESHSDDLGPDNYGEFVSHGNIKTIIRRGRNIRYSPVIE